MSLSTPGRGQSIARYKRWAASCPRPGCAHDAIEAEILLSARGDAPADLCASAARVPTHGLVDARSAAGDHILARSVHPPIRLHLPVTGSAGIRGHRTLGVPRSAVVDLAFEDDRPSLEELLVGPTADPSGERNLFGAVRRVMGKCGYSSVKEFQKADLIVTTSR